MTIALSFLITRHVELRLHAKLAPARSARVSRFFRTLYGRRSGIFRGERDLDADNAAKTAKTARMVCESCECVWTPASDSGWPGRIGGDERRRCRIEGAAR